MTEVKKGVGEIWRLLLFIASKQQSGAAIAYITDGDKTVNGLYVSSYTCRADSAGASEDFRAVRDTGTGRTKILAYHLIQSFAPNEVTPEQAMQIGEELCDRYLKGDYQYVLVIHTDKQHTHLHVIFNNTNLYNGLSFTTEHNQGKKTERAWAELRQLSDDICKEYGISVIDPKGKGVSFLQFLYLLCCHNSIVVNPDFRIKLYPS